MNKKIILSIIAGSALFVSLGCKKFLDVNRDPGAAAKVSDGLLLTGVQLTTAYNITGGYPARTAAFWTQQLAYNQTPPDWDTYQATSSDVNNTWSFDMYPAILMNLQVLDKQAEAEKHFHFQGIAKVMMAYNLAVTTDLWNAIPYSDGFSGVDNFKPKYDPQESIYQSIDKLLDDGIQLLQAEDEGVDQPEADDLIYGGDLDKWVQFAYLLKARYALRLSYAPQKQAATQAQAALAAVDKSFADASDNAGVKFRDAATSEAPWYQFIENWGSVVSSAHMIDMLAAKDDPRLAVVAEKSKKGEKYIGRQIGKALGDNPDSISAVGSFFKAADQSVYLGTYDELLFIKAEATYLTSGFAAAQPVLKSAVEATMKRFGLNSASAEVQAYILANCTLTAANAYEVIMTEKYISNFLSLESFNDWRRTNLPKLTVVENTYLGIKNIPRRLVYPAQEEQTNPQPEHKVTATDRVWWDTKQ